MIPITQKVKSSFGQTLTTKKGKLGYETKDENVVENVVDKINASTGVVTGQMPGAKMSDEDWTKYLAQESDERRAERHQVEQKAGVREGVITQDEADAQNLENENKGKDEDGGFQEISLPETSQDVQTRYQAANQVRRENMLDRKDHTTNRKNYSGLKRQSLANWRAAGRPGSRKDAKKGFGLNEEQKAAYEYAAANRKIKRGGAGDYNMVRDGDGKLVVQGSKNDSLRSNSGRSAGTNVVTGGGSAAHVGNIQTAVDLGHNVSAVELERLADENAKKGISKPKSMSMQTGTSTFKNLNPTSPNKEKIYDGKGNLMGDVGQKGIDKLNSKGIKFSKTPNVGSSLVPYEVKPNKIKKSATKLLTGMRDTKAKGKYGTAMKILGGVGLTALGLFTVSNIGKDDVVKKKEGTGKSWDQAYKDRDKKVYGGEHYDKEGTGKSNYIKEAKRQKGIHATTGKWDWKNAPKGDVKKPQGKPTSGGSTGSLNVNAGEIFDTDLSGINVEIPKVPTLTNKNSVEPVKTNKQVKADKKISKLEGRKSTPKRDIRIAKQKDKAAGLDRKTVKDNKKTRKFLTKNKQGIDNAVSAIMGVKSNIDPINITKPSTTPPSLTSTGSIGNPSDGRDTATQAAASLNAAVNKHAGIFKQKGWSGFQKK